jgi:hypothetical protein
VPLLAVSAGGHHRHELRGGGQERRGIADVAELLEHDGQLDRGGADAAVLVRNGQPGPVEAGQGGPQAAAVVLAVEDLAQVRRRAFLGQDLGHGGLETQLVVVEGEIHPSP